MSLGHKLRFFLFGPKKEAAAETESEEKLIDYLVSLINREDLIAVEIAERRKVKEITQIYQRELEYARLYFKLEHFIVTNKPLVIKKEFANKYEFRDDIRKRFNVGGMPIALRLIFSSENQQAANLFNLALHELISNVRYNLGDAELRLILTAATKGTLFAVPELQGDLLYLEGMALSIDTAALTEIKFAFKNIYRALLQKILLTFGEKVASGLSTKIYNDVANNFDQDLLSLFLDVAPEGFLESEKIAVLSREDLQKRVLEATEALKVEKEGVEKEVIKRTRELREEEARLVASINSLPLGFIILDNNHNVIIKNSSVERIFGGARYDSIGQIAVVFGSGVDIKAYAEESLRENRIIEVKEVTLDSKFLHLSFLPVIILRDSQEVIGYVFLIEDITEAKILERAREEFFAVASHELRTPLTAIRGNMALIKEFFADKIKEKDILEMVDDSHESSIRLIKIVNDFLDVSSLELGRVKFEKEKFDVVTLIQETIKVLSPAVKAKKIYLELDVPKESIPQALADKERTRQIILNLLHNAVDFTAVGGVKVAIKKQKELVEVSVKDTGVGISPQNQALLFRKFQQAGEKILARDVTRGTGLGLYISKLLVEGMGGEIKLEKSAVGIGSVFSFTLPFVSE